MKFYIGNKEYKIKSDWSQIKIKDILSIGELPKPLQEIYKGEKKELSPEEQKVIYDFYKRLIYKFSNVPQRKIEFADDLALDLYSTFLEKFVLFAYDFIIADADEFVPEGDCFYFRLRKYYYPETIVYDDINFYLTDTEIVRYSEVADIVQNKRVDKLNYIPALLCKGYKKEQYSEGKVIKRAKKFLNLPMHIVIGFFLHTERHLIELRKTTNIYSKELAQKVVEQLQRELKKITI